MTPNVLKRVNRNGCRTNRGPGFTPNQIIKENIYLEFAAEWFCQLLIDASVNFIHESRSHS